MAIFRNDRDRRINGDRIVAQHDDFGTIDEAVGRVHKAFIDRHLDLQAKLEVRRTEEGDDSRARRQRDDAAAVALQHYRWGYHQVRGLLAPSWETSVEAADEDLVREQLFVLGNPTAVGASHQLTHDALTHFLAAVPQVKAVTWPEPFLAAAGKSLLALTAALAAISVETGQTEACVAAHLEARAAWDQHHSALREVTSGFLRLTGQIDKMDALFRGVVRRPGAGGDAVEGDGGGADVVPGADALAS